MKKYITINHSLFLERKKKKNWYLGLMIKSIIKSRRYRLKLFQKNKKLCKDRGHSLGMLHNNKSHSLG